jgi:hypothetical protein
VIIGQRVTQLFSAWRELTPACFNITPAFLLSAYKWLLTYKALNPSGANGNPNAMLSLPTVLATSDSPIRADKATRANQMLRAEIAKCCFSAWLTYNRRIRNGLFAIKQRTVAPVLHAWMEVTTFRRWAGFVVTRHCGEKMRAKAAAVFSGWAGFARKSAALRREYRR